LDAKINYTKKKRVTRILFTNNAKKNK
jgi:hypothetical protein